MSTDRILTECRDGVFTATINRPARLNAADRATAADLRDALREAREDDDVRAVVITGVGRGWCSGADLARDEDQPVMSRNVRKTPLYEYAQVTQLIDGMDKMLADTAAAHPEFAGKTLSVINLDTTNGQVNVYKPTDPRVQVLTELGFVNSPGPAPCRPICARNAPDAS